MTAGGPTGLTGAEVADRRSRGLGNDLPATNTRTFRQILRANLLTRFNLLLGGLLVVILVVGPINDALFGGVLVANALIGIVQEVRAKRTLDRLASCPPPGPGSGGTARSPRSPSTRSCSTTCSSCRPATRSWSTAR